MKKMKNILSVVLVILMVLSAMPLTVGGVEAEPQSSEDVATNASFRLKLTDKFGIMVIAANVDGFVFSTDANADWNTLEKVKGQTYQDSERLYAIYGNIDAVDLAKTIYFVAYKQIGNELCWSNPMSVNPYDVANDLQDGIYGNQDGRPGVVIPSIDELEQALYGALCEYCDAWRDYVTPNWRKTVTINGAPLSSWAIGVPSSNGIEARLAEELAVFFTAETEQRIPIVTPNTVPTNVKNIITIGAKGRSVKVPDYFAGEYYVVKKDTQGTVVTLLSTVS